MANKIPDCYQKAPYQAWNIDLLTGEVTELTGPDVISIRKTWDAEKVNELNVGFGFPPIVPEKDGRFLLKDGKYIPVKGNRPTRKA